MDADDIIASQEANAVADRLLGGDPGADSANVEQFFNQAAHIHGRGLGSSFRQSSQGTILPASALAKSLKRGRTRKLAQDDEDHKGSGKSRSASTQDLCTKREHPSSDDDEDEEGRPGSERMPAHNPKALTKQELLGGMYAAAGLSKRKRKRQKAMGKDVATVSK